MKYTPAEIAQAAELYPALWILQHNIKNETGMPIEFEKRKFQWDMYNDLSPKQATLKPPQIGETVKNLVKSFYVAKKLKKDIIYTLPTQSDVQDMAGGKINRIIAQNPILREWTKDHDNVEQKTVGDNIIYYRGTFTQKAAMMVSSSLNMHDEIDASNPEVVNQYETRLEAQDDESKKWRWYFSHPSLSGHGIDIYWQKSDKKEWNIICPYCTHRQVLTWPESVSMERQTYICLECKKDLPNESRINGEWYNQDGIKWKNKIEGEYEFSGWHVSQLMLWNKSAKDIITSFNDPLKDKQYFYNYVLGLPYIGSDDKIEPSVVLRNCVDKVNEQEGRNVIGLDTGHGIHLTVMNKQGVFYYDNVTEITASKDPYDEVRKLLNTWKRSIVISDQGGDLIGIRKLQAEFPGRVFLCFYRKDRKSVDLVQWGENEESGKVTVDRNRMMQLVVEQIRETGRIRLNGTKDEWTEFASHFGNMYREKIVVKESREKDDRTLYGNEYVWKRNGPDHYCFVAGTKIKTLQGDINIENIKIGTLVATRNGFKPVYHVGKTQENVRVLTAYFSNGSVFTATPDHPIITTEGKIRLDCITPHAILYEWQIAKKLSIKELLIEDIQILKGESLGSISRPMEPFEQKDNSGFINKYGRMLTALFLKVLSFIIKTVIRSITKLQTWSVNRELFIKAIIEKTGLMIQITDKEILNIWQGLEVNLTRGLLPPKVNGIHKLMPSSFLCYLNPKVLYVLSAILQQLHEAIRAVSFARADVVIVGLHENIEKKDVMNIAVSEEPEYIANGILVSNCHALLYAIVGLQRYGGEMAKVLGDSLLDGMARGQIVNAEGVSSFMRAEGEVKL